MSWTTSYRKRKAPTLRLLVALAFASLLSNALVAIRDFLALRTCLEFVVHILFERIAVGAHFTTQRVVVDRLTMRSYGSSYGVFTSSGRYCIQLHRLLNRSQRSCSDSYCSSSHRSISLSKRLSRKTSAPWTARWND
jgi:hypothetical protein